MVQDCNSGPLPLRMSSKSFPVCVLDHEGLLQAQSAVETHIISHGVADQSNWASWTKLGNTWRAMGEPYKAMQCFRKATALKGSEDPDVLLNIALVLRHSNALEDAVEVIDRAITLSPNGVLYLFIRGEICVELQRYDQARLDFGKALQVSPNFIAAANKVSMGDTVICWPSLSIPIESCCLRRELALQQTNNITRACRLSTNKAAELNTLLFRAFGILPGRL
eukprot:SAG22_NODE_4890_length_1140_cov_1.185399_1_plen_222_part_10